MKVDAAKHARGASDDSFHHGFERFRAMVDAANHTRGASNDSLIVAGDQVINFLYEITCLLKEGNRKAAAIVLRNDDYYASLSYVSLYKYDDGLFCDFSRRETIAKCLLAERHIYKQIIDPAFFRYLSTVEGPHGLGQVDMHARHAGPAVRVCCCCCIGLIFARAARIVATNSTWFRECVRIMECMGVE